MITIEPTKDVAYLESCMKGKGITRRCWGGYEPQDIHYGYLANMEGVTFLKVTQDGRAKGFMVLIGEKGGAVGIHLCLKTLGRYTREAFRQALEFAKSLDAKVVNAFYPADHRAVNMLLDDFHFQDVEHHEITPVPYRLKTLNLK